MRKARVPLIVAGALLVPGLPCAEASQVPESHDARRRAAERTAGFDLRVISADATSVRLQWPPDGEATEYRLLRDGLVVGSTVGKVGYFTDFGLRPGKRHDYRVEAVDESGAVIARSEPASAMTRPWSRVRRDYTVLAIAFDPEALSLVTEATYVQHRIQFLELASLGSARIRLYGGGIVSSAIAPDVEPGTNGVDYIRLVTRRDLPGLDGYSIVDLVEKGDIDHVWVVRAPVEFAENALLGNRPIHGEGVSTGNTWVPIPVKCSRSFFVNAFSSDERSYDAYAHMIEGIMVSVSEGHPDNWPRDSHYIVYTPDCTSFETREARLTLWERFRLADEWNGESPSAYASKGNGNMGSSHFPPSAIRNCTDYAYSFLEVWQRYIDSEADDWLDFPRFSNVKRKLNGYDYGGFNHYVEGDPSYSAVLGATPELHPSFQFGRASFHQWWFAHLPHNPGVRDGKLNDWWPYIFDFNRFDGSRIDYRVLGLETVPTHLAPTHFAPVRGEYGTEGRRATRWGYWHSQNGFSPGGKAAVLRVVSRADGPNHVKAGRNSLKVTVENTQYWEVSGFGRNDVFYPASRNAHWQLPDLASVDFSVEPGENEALLVGTNPIVRLYKNRGNRIELVPRLGGVYANLFWNGAEKDSEGWYNFSVPLAGNATWEKNVIGYVDPDLSEAEQDAARIRLERDILADLNYVEISIRSTTTRFDAPYDVVSYYIDGLKLLTRGGSVPKRGGR